MTRVDDNAIGAGLTVFWDMKLNARVIAPSDWPEDTLFVVYCAGPHCNGGDRAALCLAGLGWPVKLMLGGMTGWADEGFAHASGDAPGSVMDAGIPVTQAG